MWEDTDCTDSSAIQWLAKVMTVPDLSSEDTHDVGKRARVVECSSPLALFPIYLFLSEERPPAEAQRRRVG
jgi:hypothetical protein